MDRLENHECPKTRCATFVAINMGRFFDAVTKTMKSKSGKGNMLDVINTFMLHAVTIIDAH